MGYPFLLCFEQCHEGLALSATQVDEHPDKPERLSACIAGRPGIEGAIGGSIVK